MSKRKTRATRHQPPATPKRTDKLGRPLTPRCSAAESLSRTSTVFVWILEGVPSHEIVEKGQVAWSVGEAQVRDYIAKATATLREEAKARAGATLEDHLTARWHCYRRLCEGSAWKDAAMVLKDIGRLQAIYASDRSLLAKAGLDESLTAALADGTEAAADILRGAYELRNKGD